MTLYWSKFFLLIGPQKYDEDLNKALLETLLLVWDYDHGAKEGIREDAVPVRMLWMRIYSPSSLWTFCFCDDVSGKS